MIDVGKFWSFIGVGEKVNIDDLIEFFMWLINLLAPMVWLNYYAGP